MFKVGSSHGSGSLWARRKGSLPSLVTLLGPPRRVESCSSESEEEDEDGCNGEGVREAPAKRANGLPPRPVSVANSHLPPPRPRQRKESTEKESDGQLKESSTQREMAATSETDFPRKDTRTSSTLSATKENQAPSSMVHPTTYNPSTSCSTLLTLHSTATHNSLHLQPFKRGSPCSGQFPLPPQQSTATAVAPSSTYPSFLGNSSSTLETEVQGNRTKEWGLSSSSTFPESRTPLANINVSSNHPPQFDKTPHSYKNPTAATNHQKLPPKLGEKTTPLVARDDYKQLADGNPTPALVNSAQSIPSSKPPLDPSSIKKTVSKIAVESAPAPPPPSPEPLSLSPEQENSVVALKSQNGERVFKKLSLVGRGGSSKVYKVISKDYQVFALKEVYIKHVDPAIKKAYINEIKLLMQFREKPEIITLHDYDWDRQEGVLYLLLEYAEMDLNAVIRNRGHNRLAMAVYFWNEMLQIVKVIHEGGVIHNDLKPENFVCIGARLRLIDFGIASRIETEKTSIERDVRCGTINYMAPETIDTYEDKDFFKVGRPSDIWSLGCILYVMVYGRTPFEHIKNKLKKWHAITDPSVSISFPDVGNRAAVDIMKKCLQRNPKERPTIEELVVHPFSCFREMPS